MREHNHFRTVGWTGNSHGFFLIFFSSLIFYRQTNQPVRIELSQGSTQAEIAVLPSCCTIVAAPGAEVASLTYLHLRIQPVF